jgi:hypothetical protein
LAPNESLPHATRAGRDRKPSPTTTTTATNANVAAVNVALNNKPQLNASGVTLRTQYIVVVVMFL